MIRKMYVLRTWMHWSEPSQTSVDRRIQHLTDLSVYIAHPVFEDPKSVSAKSLVKSYKKNKMSKGKVTPQITTDRCRAMKFRTKKEALQLAAYYGGCQVDPVWLFQKPCQGKILNLYA